MTLKEFSQEFDILYNNISSNQAPGIIEYEKSVFLTQAQEAIILDLYKGVTGDSFETTEEVTRYLNSLVTTFTVSKLSNEESLLDTKESKVELPADVMFVTYQSANVNGRDVIVVPINQDSLFSTLQNPFKGPNKNRILSISENNQIHLYSKDIISKYYIKYLKNPYPIILENLNGEDSINGKTTAMEITWLPESLHRQILLRAVQIAKAVWAS